MATRSSLEIHGFTVLNASHNLLSNTSGKLRCVIERSPLLLTRRC